VIEAAQQLITERFQPPTPGLRRLAHQVAEALALIGADVRDYLIVGDAVTSLCTLGLI